MANASTRSCASPTSPSSRRSGRTGACIRLRSGTCGTGKARYFFTGRRSRKWRNLLANPELSLCVDRNERPYAYVVVQGTAAESGRSLHDAAFEMAAIYYGPERAARTAARYRDGDPSLVLVEITPRSVVAWEQGRPRARGTDAD